MVKKLYCKNCGYENDDDASFCENCGANLRPNYSQSSTGMSSTNKILIFVVIVLIAGIGIAAGVMLTSITPVNNTTTNNTSVSVSEPVSTPRNSAETGGPKLIDSGSTSGINAQNSNDGPYTYEWKTYQVDENNLVIYSTYIAGSKSVKQTATLKIWDQGTVLVTVEPKMSGKSSWSSVTSIQGYSTVLDFYWGYYKGMRETNGPIH